MSRHRLTEPPSRPRRAARRGLQLAVTVLVACCVPLLAALLTSAGAPGTTDSTATELLAKHRKDRRWHTPSAAPTTAAAPTSKAPSAAPSTAPPDPAAGAGGTVGQVLALFGGPSSPWGQAVAAGATVDPGSAAMVRGLSGTKFVMSHKLWTVPVYVADTDTPRVDVRLTSGWQRAGTLRNVPLPAAARPDPSEDAHLSIVDTSTRCVYDFWAASRSGSGLSAMVGNAIPLDSDGVYSDGLGSRGSGFSAAAGIVTADELRRGTIDHALVFAAPTTRAGGPVAPASKSDGRSSGANTIPEGARLRLDPSIDLDALGLNRYELTIARAMQRYGMILGDTSGGFTIYSQHPQSLPAGAYTGLLPDDTWVDLTRIPTSRLQVMKLPPQTATRSGTAANRCNGF